MIGELILAAAGGMIVGAVLAIMFRAKRAAASESDAARAEEYKRRLNRIVSQDTLNSNATVQRIMKIARGEIR